MILIAGPCVIESFDHCAFLADAILQRATALGFDFFFKASFDKANRTSGQSYRGPGLERGLEILMAVKQKTGAKVTTDIHEPSQARAAAEVVDLIQIPALLCRQTDLIVAAARTGKPINLKKGQFMAPWDMRHVIDKARSAGAERLFITERGTSFGYNNLIVDFRGIPTLKAHGFPVLVDVSHAVQFPGGGPAGTASTGDRTMIPTLARAAIAAGAGGIYIEVHDKPDEALSDGQNSFELKELPRLLRALDRIEKARAEPGEAE